MDAKERAILEEMERNLMSEDARFAERFTQKPRPTKLALGVACVVAGLAIVIFGISVGTGIGTGIGVVGFVLMFFGATRLLPAMTMEDKPSTPRVSAPSAPPHER